MCGVFGRIGDLPAGRQAGLSRAERALAHRLLVELAAASEERGVDAAGFAALTSRGELIWRRQPGPARALFQGPEFARLRRRHIPLAIGHTRHATKGAPAINGNNHPHLAGDWALVHNGHIHDHKAIAAAHGLRLTSECDSEVLVRTLAHYGEHEGPVRCLGMGGSQSVLALDRRTRRLLAWTNGEMPLVAFRVEGIAGLWWASTAEIAAKALDVLGLEARFADAEPAVIYRMEVCDGQVVMEADRAAEPAA